ncbi:RagB/SusD family nutrient uptake outer membrane protein [uncultured Bacteroides sp.]|uniref:RagB/SusD family nutrient uptake outer membrane protein n=1 Tax=uncultured Bacteroides sp. TaxID=162156 RepID=UPI0026750E31|nr:RagB/SusD family nutrient uptake outer membrane protein [uncultured Bacteroides sp.]
MKTKKILLQLSTTAIIACSLISCNDFLDTMPDKRTEIDTPEKVRDILVAAYPDQNPMLLFEYMSDDYTDNGDTYGSPSNIVIESYYWEDPVESDQDSPAGIWTTNYKAIATANQALESIKAMGTPEECLPYKGEALLCRAYAHFVLANTFCMAYNPQTASTNLGIPYVTETEKTVGMVYERGTLQDVYEKINADIEAALPLIKGITHDIPLYHFNEKAAYAFAARFNLFYGKDYNKVIDYATQAIGENPTSVLRDLNGYNKYTNSDEWTYGYIDEEEPANLLLIANSSLYGRSRGARYGITESTLYDHSVWSTFPGGKQLTVYTTVFHYDYVSYFVPKMNEIFEITNQVAQTGYPHVVLPAFTTDETLLCRAEAHVLKKEYEAAATDLSYWYMKKGTVANTAKEIMEFYKNNDNLEELNTGLTYEPEQVLMLSAVLHARRVEGIHEGIRWLDIKRYGISYEHVVHNSSPIVLKANDLRKAIQIPSEVLAAPGGMTPNPR